MIYRVAGTEILAMQSSQTGGHETQMRQAGQIRGITGATGVIGRSEKGEKRGQKAGIATHKVHKGCACGVPESRSRATVAGPAILRCQTSTTVRPLSHAVAPSQAARQAGSTVTGSHLQQKGNHVGLASLANYSQMVRTAVFGTCALQSRSMGQSVSIGIACCNNHQLNGLKTAE